MAIDAQLQLENRQKVYSFEQDKRDRSNGNTYVEPALFRDREEMEEEWKPQLITLIQSGKAMRQRIIQQINLQSSLSVGGAIISLLSGISEDEWLQDLESLRKKMGKLNLPKPLQDLYNNYLLWNRECDEFFRKKQWKSTNRAKDFIRLRREFGRKISVRKPQLPILKAIMIDQLSILESILNDPPKATKKIKKAKKKEKGWSTRKVVGTSIYVIVCVALDTCLLPMIGLGVLALVGAELAVLLGFPKLIEWLKE